MYYDPEHTYSQFRVGEGQQVMTVLRPVLVPVAAMGSAQGSMHGGGMGGMSTKQLLEQQQLEAEQREVQLVAEQKNAQDEARLLQQQLDDQSVQFEQQARRAAGERQQREQEEEAAGMAEQQQLEMVSRELKSKADQLKVDKQLRNSRADRLAAEASSSSAPPVGMQTEQKPLGSSQLSRLSWMLSGNALRRKRIRSESSSGLLRRNLLNALCCNPLLAPLQARHATLQERQQRASDSQARLLNDGAAAPDRAAALHDKAMLDS